MEAKRETGHTIGMEPDMLKMQKKTHTVSTMTTVCVLPVDEGEQRHQEINGWIPLQRLYLLSQRHLERQR